MNGQAIDQHMVRQNPQCCDRTTHCLMGRSQNIQLVNFMNIRTADSNKNSIDGKQGLPEACATGRGKFFGIVEFL